MKKVLIIYLFSVYLASSKCEGQDSCLSIGLYRTDSVGNEKEKIIIPLVFNITHDSVIIYPGSNQTMPFLAFKILDKRCEWKEDFSEGKTSFRLRLKENGTEKYPTLNLLYISRKNHFFELLYENSERRIFTIVNLAD